MVTRKPSDCGGGCWNHLGLGHLRQRVFFTSPSAFLTFCTLGREIPTALAIWLPDLPAFTSFFTWARVASVMTARLRRYSRTLNNTPALTRKAATINSGPGRDRRKAQSRNVESTGVAAASILKE